MNSAWETIAAQRDGPRHFDPSSTSAKTLDHRRTSSGAFHYEHTSIGLHLAA
jgi:hypothetical protein